MARMKTALGVEISEDRTHVAVVGAGYVSKGIIMLDLLAYLTGPGTTPTVLRLCRAKNVQAIAVDPPVRPQR